MTKTTTKIKIMKKTLIALLALGSLAMAGEKTLTFTTDTKDFNATGGAYNGIAFTLSDNSRLDASFKYGDTTTFSLTSIEVQVRSDKSWGSNTCMYIVDADKTFVAMSEGVTEDVSGGNNVTFQFNKTSSLIKEGKEKTNAPLTLGTTYYAYFANTTHVTQSHWYVGTVGIGDVVTSLDSEAKQLSAFGQYPEDSIPSDLTFLTAGLSTPTLHSGSLKYAPMVGINGTINAPVPEPTTGTLSLLALAGLCARRRKK